METPVPRAPGVLRGCLDLPGNQEEEVAPGQTVPEACRASQGPRVTVDSMDCLVSQGIRATGATPDPWEFWDLRARMERGVTMEILDHVVSQVNPDLVDYWDQKALLGLLDLQESAVTTAPTDPKETWDHKESQVLQDSREPQELRECQDLKVPSDPQGTRGPQGSRGSQGCLALTAPQVTQARRGLLEPRVTRVPAALRGPLATRALEASREHKESVV